MDKPIVQFTTFEEMLQKNGYIVYTNIGVSMLSELILINRHNDVNLVPIVPASCRQLGIALPHDKVLSPVQKRFIAITKEYVKTFARPSIY